MDISGGSEESSVCLMVGSEVGLNVISFDGSIVGLPVVAISLFGSEEGAKVGSEEVMKVGSEEGVKVGSEEGVKIGSKEGVIVGSKDGEGLNSKNKLKSKWAGPAKFSQSQDNYKSTNVDYNPFTFRV